MQAIFAPVLQLPSLRRIISIFQHIITNINTEIWKQFCSQSNPNEKTLLIRRGNSGTPSTFRDVLSFVI